MAGLACVVDCREGLGDRLASLLAGVVGFRECLSGRAYTKLKPSKPDSGDELRQTAAATKANRTEHRQLPVVLHIIF